MAATKTCPSCGEDVPIAANRCKECFHDFNEVAPRRGAGLLVVLGSLAAAALLGVAFLAWIASMPLERRILVDQETESVVFTSLYRTGAVTDRLRFTEIASVEHVVHQNGTFEVIAITISGDRVAIGEGNRSMRGEAEQYARIMEKPFNEVDHTRGFHRRAIQQQEEEQ